MQKSIFTLLLLFLFVSVNLSIACDPNESTVIVNIHTDNWGYETSWRLVDGNGTIYHEVPFDTYANDEFYETEVCVPTDACITFIIEDSYGDGIFHEDGYVITVDGVEMGSGGAFGYEATLDFNCPPGSTCNSAIPITEGDYVTAYDNAWYTFVPDSVGII